MNKYKTLAMSQDLISFINFGGGCSAIVLAPSSLRMYHSIVKDTKAIWILPYREKSINSNNGTTLEIANKSATVVASKPMRD